MRIERTHMNFNTIPVLRSRGNVSLISLWFSNISPLLISSKPAIIRNKVDSTLLGGPTITINSPYL